jgi:hypothetical protein
MIHHLIFGVWVALQISPVDSKAPGAATDVQLILDSGRVVTVAEAPSKRVSPRPLIAPGKPPLLSFRYYEGLTHSRFGNNELVLDDAGH